MAVISRRTKRWWRSGLAQGRYSDALAEATALNKSVPDDNLLYGYLADAQMELGNYQAALKATQWMINQRPVNAPGLQRGAQLREDSGYGEPALDWWNSSLRITSSSDLEELAWILVNMSRVALRMGKAANAEGSARQALDLVANYPLASDALAAALIAQDKPADALEILEAQDRGCAERSRGVSFGSSGRGCGNKAETAAAFARFEKMPSPACRSRTMRIMS